MYSVIMPTMWRSQRTAPLLDVLQNSEFVDEVIVIDNEVSSRPDIEFGDKVKLLDQEDNIYVNPAWNLGVKESKNKYLCIINDDISLDFDFGMPLITEFLQNTKSVIGVHPLSYRMHPNDYTFNVSKGHYIGHGWGCCMFLRKERWVDIPHDIKIWFGDNWIAKEYTNNYSFLKAIQTEMQTTSSSPDLKSIIKDDIKSFKSNE